MPTGGFAPVPAASAPRRSQGDAGGDGDFPGKESLVALFCWLDYLDELVAGAHPVRSTQTDPPSTGCPRRGSGSAPLPQLVAGAVAEAVEEKFFQGVLQPQLLQM